MDWRGRPAKDRRLGGWRSSIFILGAFALCNSAYFGVVANLVIYLVRVWDESNASAANNVTNLVGTTFFCSLIGAFVSDAYLGRLWATIVFEVILLVGCIATSSTALVTAGTHQALSPAALRSFLFTSLYLVALGNGSILPNIASLGADQLDAPHEKAKFFILVVMFVNVGQIFALTVITYFDDREMWVLGFWLCTAAAGAATIVSITSAKGCRQYRAGGNPLARIAQVFVAATRKRNVRVAVDPGLLYELPGELSAIPGCRKLQHTERCKYLDKAACMLTDDDLATANGKQPSPWRVCTVTQVEEVKCIARIIPAWLAGVCFTAIVAQINTLFVVQATTTDAKVGRLPIPAASMQLFVIAGAIMFVTIYNGVVAGWLRRRTGHAKGASEMQLQGFGIGLGVLAMVVASLVEMRRLSMATRGAKIAVWWLVPQNLIVGAAANCFSGGQLDMFYTEVSDGMKGLGSSLAMCCLGLGNYASTVFVVVVTAITTRGGRPGWITPNLNDGHLDYFYLFLASLTAFTFLLFLAYARSYTYRPQTPLPLELTTTTTTTLIPPTAPSLSSHKSGKI